jgi:hypothetical protein
MSRQPGPRLPAKSLLKAADKLKHRGRDGRRHKAVNLSRCAIKSSSISSGINAWRRAMPTKCGSTIAIQLTRRGHTPDLVCRFTLVSWCYTFAGHDHCSAIYPDNISFAINYDFRFGAFVESIDDVAHAGGNVSILPAAAEKFSFGRARRSLSRSRRVKVSKSNGNFKRPSKNEIFVYSTLILDASLAGRQSTHNDKKRLSNTTSGGIMCSRSTSDQPAASRIRGGEYKLSKISRTNKDIVSGEGDCVRVAYCLSNNG